MNTETGNLAALVQEKLNADTEFLASLEDLTDDEKAEAIAEKNAEIANAIFAEKLAESKKNDELAKNYKVRAEKAEGKKVEDPKPEPQKESESTLTPLDMYALMTAQVHKDDIQEVVKAAKLLGKTIDEALEDSTVKVILKTRTETRATAEAMNTSTTRGKKSEVSDAEILEKTRKGEVPEPGSSEAERLFWARRGRKPQG